MQLVQPSKFCSVPIFLDSSIGSIGMHACKLGVTLKNFAVCTVTMGVALSEKSISPCCVSPSLLASFYLLDFHSPSPSALQPTHLEQQHSELGSVDSVSANDKYVTLVSRCSHCVPTFGQKRLLEAEISIGYTPKARLLSE